LEDKANGHSNYAMVPIRNTETQQHERVRPRNKQRVGLQWDKKVSL